MDNWLLGSAFLSSGAGPGFSYERSARAIARDGRDFYFVQSYAAGRCSVVRGATAVTSEPGDLVVTDLASPSKTQETSFRNVSFLVPRSLIAPLLRQPDIPGVRVLNANAPLATLASRHLHELAAQAPRLTEMDTQDVVGATVQLIAAAINGSTDDATANGVDVALGCRMRRFIEERLSSSDLAPETLAAAFGVSRATVYRLFVHDGGVRRYIQERRLTRARLDLIGTRAAHLTVAEIGEAAGYAHAQDFIRAYRRQFGIRPGEEREQARVAGRTQLKAQTSERPPWVEWVRRMRT
jgi:AraC-like DNA-binding protein